MRSAFQNLQCLADHDPVELGDGPAGMKTSPAIGEPMMMGEIAQAPAAHAPFVQITHQNASRVALPRGQVRKHGMRLTASPQARKIQMHADHAYFGTPNTQIGEHRAARLQRRQMNQIESQYLYILFHQQGVAMPTQASAPGFEWDGLIIAMLIDHVQRQRADPRAEPAVCLLQRDHIGTDFVQNLDSALGPALSVGADRLAHVITGNEDHPGPY